ncbi:MAG: ABC transporter ATP-binding protein [Clostridia bacterium]|jgi:ABC-2 type transport system ATP-binding protein|nr:ABC transporter ATP-binding protein [Clostridia bacterium]
MENILEIQNLRKEYNGFILKDMCLTLPQGYILGFIGPNGAGKTTVIKLIMNLIKRNAGEIKVFGLDNLAYEREIKQRIGFVYDENFFYEELNSLEIGLLMAPAYTDWDNKLFRRYLDDFKLPPKKPLKKFSKGMKMKLSLALCLSHHPQFLLMDEPTSGLDPVFRREVLMILQEFMTDETKGILLSSHITSDLDKIADYVCFINNGEIMLNCSKEEVLEKYGIVKGERKTLDGELRRELVGLQESEFGFSGLTADKEKVRGRWKDAVFIERPTLEDIMVYAAGRGEA